MTNKTLWLVTALTLSACAAAPPVVSADGAVPAAERVVRGGPLDLTGGVGAGCQGSAVRRGGQSFLRLSDDSLVAAAPLGPVADGSPYTYHPKNQAGGAILHRCNAGEVHLPDGSRYEGASSNAVCTGRFERDAAKIEAADWTDPAVGAIRWHSIAAVGSARIDGALVPRARPLVRGDGYYVSRTALEDIDYAVDPPERYVDAGLVAYSVVRPDQGVPLGSYGVALRTRGCGRGRTCAPVPFIVADYGAGAGAGSLALSYSVSGLPMPDRFDSENRYRGQAGPGEVLTVFFGGAPQGGSLKPAAIELRARAAFEAWGGEERLYRCRRVAIPALDGA